MHQTTVTLLPIDRDGTVRDYQGSVPDVATDALRMTSELYGTVGFEGPWIGYLAVVDQAAVGTCAFKSPPADNRVEIAYFTFPEFEGRGVAFAMAAALVAMARQRAADVIVAAQTLPQRNASHRILEKLGFRHVATLEDPEDGTVWEWQLAVDV